MVKILDRADTGDFTPEVGDKSEAARRQLSITFNTIGAVVASFFGVVTLIADERSLLVEGTVLLGMGAVLFGLALALRRGLPVATVASLAGASVLIGVASLALLSDTFPTHLLMWMSVIPLAAILLNRPVAATVWTLGGIGIIIACYVKAGCSAAGPPPVVEPFAVVALIVVSLALARISGDLRQSIIRRNERLQAQVTQAHQLQNMGEVAGAIAHDFNNVLTVIQSYAGLLLDGFDKGDERADDLREIVSACELATELTSGLRTFAQNQPAQSELLDLANLARDIEPLLKSLLGERIDVVVDVPPSLGPVRADRSQLERVIANLTLNARDAMPEGGTVSLTGDIAYVSRVEVAMGLEEGPYGRLSFRDTGVGMSAEVAKRAFEPFFTTKGRGQGTGLGLSTAYGTLRAAGGDLRLSSTPGRGTTFEILLPLVDEAPRVPTPTESPLPTVEGSETVLVVDDQPALARSVERLLQTGGYRVLMASSYRDALARFDEHGAAIELLLTDVVMPDRTGPELAVELRRRNPELAVIFMSGYTGDSLPVDLDALNSGRVDRGGYRFIKKPFTRDKLLEVVRRALDEASEPLET